jgi:hypothetical protein
MFRYRVLRRILGPEREKGIEQQKRELNEEVHDS